MTKSKISRNSYLKSYVVCSQILILFFAIGCLSEKQTKEGLAFINVNNDYPVKEIFLTDIADVTYIHLSTTDEDYLYKGRIHCITENTIVVDNTGDILFFTKSGKPKSRFNRQGQGSEEYIFPMRILYDEATDDVFVLDNQRDRILFYSSTGMYKRELAVPQGTLPVNSLVSYDNVSLFFYDEKIILKRMAADYNKMADSVWVSPFYLISKNDGAVLDHVEMKIAPIFLGTSMRDGQKLPPRGMNRIVKSKEGIFLCNPESDTVFHYLKNQPPVPVIYKTPPVASTDPMTYLNTYADEGNYQFMEVFTVVGNEFASQIPVKYYMRDKKTGEVIHPKISLPHYNGKEFDFRSARREYVNGNMYFELDLVDLKQAHSEHKLSGKLEELVAALNEDEDNNIFMILDFK